MGNQTSDVDVVVVGAGIVGLAFALAEARRGRRVAVLERERQAQGASVRNFGLVWPLGQPFGPGRDRAMRSRALWLELARPMKLWHRCSGSLQLAYAEDELAVLEEFAELSRGAGGSHRLLTPAETAERTAVARLDGLWGALWSEDEVMLDPREAIRRLPQYLAERFGVTFEFATPVTGIAAPRVETSRGAWRADSIYVCSGVDFVSLYPEVFRAAGLTQCKLQMLRTVAQPEGWSLGPVLSSGLTLIRYASFRACPTLEPLRQRLSHEFPECIKEGIHVLLAETPTGQLTLGDSHEYGDAPDPFDRAAIDAAILSYAQRIAQGLRWEIAERWHGFYAVPRDDSEWIHQPEAGVTIVTGLGGSGMTLSLGLAEEWLEGQGRSRQGVKFSS